LKKVRGLPRRGEKHWGKRSKGDFVTERGGRYRLNRSQVHFLNSCVTKEGKKTKREGKKGEQRPRVNKNCVRRRGRGHSQLEGSMAFGEDPEKGGQSVGRLLDSPKNIRGLYV